MLLRLSRWPRNWRGPSSLLEKGRKPLLSCSSPCPKDFSNLGTRILRDTILCYQWVLSPLLGRTCRFYPSCSSYALAAVGKYGALRGVGLALLRLAKCHPWHPGGFDPLRYF